jgi:NRAMP (natural resistance-associated macrophage protein)-like metal ion transporter
MSDDVIERMAGAPAAALEKTIDTSKQLADSVSTHAHVKKAKEYWHTLGPGLTTGAADDDPSGIATYSQTGAGYGFQLLWLAGITFPLMAIVQEMCARIGMVTGRGLAANIRTFYPRWVLYLCTILLFGANVLNIGADLGAMAKATQLLAPKLSFEFLVLGFAIFSLGLQIFTSYASYAKYLKWLALVLLAYIFTTVSIPNLDWAGMIKGALVPSITFSREQLFLICAILGTTISPYLFFWQTSQEVEEQILDGKTTLKSRQAVTSNKEIKNMRLDVWSGMFLSNLVMFFIIAACAATLYSQGIFNIETAAEAAQALKPIAGDWAYTVFALGIIGTGLLAIPVLAGSTSYALSESLNWKHGLYRKLKEANAFYGVIILATLIGVGLNLLNIDPMKALIYSAVANGIVAPVVLILIVMMSSNKKIMGERTNHPIIAALGWLITGVMVIAGLAAIASIFF